MPRTIIENIVIAHYKDVETFEFCQYTKIRFFEIFYFEAGTGFLKINGNDVAYAPNSFFVFIPGDIYIVDANSKTTVTTVKFLKSVFQNTGIKDDWFQKIEVVLANSNNLIRKLELQSNSDKKKLAYLIDILKMEYINLENRDWVIIKNLLSSVLRISSRNIRRISITNISLSQDSKVQNIIDFIQEHIYDPNLLTNRALAEEFNLADTYIGQYFKKHMGMSIKKYILNYKLKLVEMRLRYTGSSISEIASEFGFTDSSHLHKTFLAYNGVSMATFKFSLQK